MEKKNKSIILTIVAVATLIALVVGATYAYFQAQGGIAASADVRVTTYTTDLLTFTTGNDMTIYADQANFADGLGNQTGETFARAHLLANNKTNSATANYYVYLNVTNNTFEYTQEDETAELLLQVIDPSGTEVTTLTGLEYKTVTDGKGETVKGFDVTTFEGLATIANNYEIVANNEITQTWIVNLVFVNLDADQTANAGNGLSAKLIIQKGLLLSAYVQNLYTGTQGENSLYYHNGTIKTNDTVVDADDGSYRYAGGDYKLTTKSIDAGLTKIVASDGTSTNGVINFYCDGTKTFFNLSCESTSYYTLEYDLNAIQYETYKEALAKAVEDGYLTNGNIKNYVCFGSDEEICSDDNLYRIIGVFGDKVKLIKSEHSNNNLLGENGSYIGTNGNSIIKYSYLGNTLSYSWYAWNNYTNTNVWSEANLNNVNLNINYLSNIGEDWANLIENTLWKVGGNSHENILNKPIRDVYDNEIVNFVDNTTENAKIGLMYASDYGYATLPEYWNMSLFGNAVDDNNYRFAISDNWLYNGEFEWLITRCSDTDNTVYFVNVFGGLSQNDGVDIRSSGVRPTFYLKNSVNYLGGIGTKLDPIRLG